MKQKNIYFILILCAFLMSASFQLSASPINLEELLLKNDLERSFVGIVVRSLKSGKNILSHNQYKYFTPASNQKLVTSWVALKTMGSNYHFETDIYANSISDDYKIKPDSAILIKGAGDPTLDPGEVARVIVNNLANIEKPLTGNILLDLSYFEGHFFGPGWMWDDDNNFICSLSFPEVSTLIDSPYGKGEYIKAVGNLIKSSLAEKEIKFRGRILLGVMDGSWEKIATIRSRSLAKILSNMNEISDNYLADMIWRTIGAINGGGSFAAAAKKAEEELKNIELNGEMVFADGSGLSRYNLLAPSQIVDLLDYAFRHPTLSESNLKLGYPYYSLSYRNHKNIFINTIPQWGSGTLSWRNYDLNVRAKTGTLKDASSLSGFLRTNSGEIMAFSILINRTLEIEKARNFQDQLLKELQVHF